MQKEKQNYRETLLTFPKHENTPENTFHCPSTFYDKIVKCKKLNLQVGTIADKLQLQLPEIKARWLNATYREYVLKFLIQRVNNR